MFLTCFLTNITKWVAPVTETISYIASVLYQNNNRHQATLWMPLITRWTGSACQVGNFVQRQMSSRGKWGDTVTELYSLEHTVIKCMTHGGLRHAECDNPRWSWWCQTTQSIPDLACASFYFNENSNGKEILQTVLIALPQWSLWNKQLVWSSMKNNGGDNLSKDAKDSGEKWAARIFPFLLNLEARSSLCSIKYKCPMIWLTIIDRRV